LPRLAQLVAAYDEIFAEPEAELRQVEGNLRILSPPTITSLFLGTMINNFQLQHRDVDLSIVLMDRPVNPLEEGYDVAFGAWPTSYPGVLDVPLCPYELVACCAPAYLSGRDRPKHPTELVDHQCLTTMLFKTNWGFKGNQGPINVEVHSRMQSSDMRMVRDAALKGLGITLLPYFLVDEDLMSGTLEQVLGEYPVTPFLLKAMVPRMKMSRPAVRSLVKFLEASMLEATPALTSARSEIPL